MLSKFKENRKKIFIVIGCLLAVIIAVTAGIIVYQNSDKVKIQKYLDMGNRYLADMQYEQAVVEFTKAFELDPDNPVVVGNLVSAYLDWSDALIAEDDYEKAIEILTQGYEATGDESLADRIKEIKDTLEAEEFAKVEKQFDELAHKIKNEITDIYLYGIDNPGWSVYRTFGERAEIYTPIINDLNEYANLAERYPELVKEAGEFKDSYVDAGIAGIMSYFSYPNVETARLEYIYIALGAFNLHIGNYEKCLAARTKLAEYIGDDSILSDHYWDDNYYDKYGRYLSSQQANGTNTYNDASGDFQATSTSGESGEYLTVYTFENGRLMATSYSGGGIQSDTTYSYNGDTVTETYTSSGQTQSCQFQIDKYGKEIKSTRVDLY